MSESRRQVEKILKEHGAVLARQRKHEVWKFPDGRIFVRASTPSDSNGDTNNLSDLKIFLGLNETRGIPGERRAKKPRKVKPTTVAAILSDAPQKSNIWDSLIAVVRQTTPKYRTCYPIDKQLILRTPMTVFMARLFR